jgi:uncharacterized protein (TIGR04255 family)
MTKYGKPPIVEALAEFQFSPESEWDATIPGLVYERLGGEDQFPHRDQGKVVEAQFAIDKDSLQERRIETERVRFRSADDKSIVQVSKHLLVVNRVAPYEGWDKMRPLIERASSAYLAVAQPTGLSRLGLRYINKIAIPGTRIDLEDYFDLYPAVGDRLPQDHGPFMTGIEIPYGKDLLKLQISSGMPESPKQGAIILDLDYSRMPVPDLACDATMSWLDTAHERIETAFEGCITDRTRRLFEED